MGVWAYRRVGEVASYGACLACEADCWGGTADGAGTASLSSRSLGAKRKESRHRVLPGLRRASRYSAAYHGLASEARSTTRKTSFLLRWTSELDRCEAVRLASLRHGSSPIFLCISEDWFPCAGGPRRLWLRTEASFSSSSATDGHGRETDQEKNC